MTPAQTQENIKSDLDNSHERFREIKKFGNLRKIV